MKKKQVFKFGILVVLLTIFGIAILFGYNQSYTVKYYETFQLNTYPEKNKEITFINELSVKQIEGKWHLKVYYNQDGTASKFENFDTEGNLYGTINDIQNLKIKENN